MDADGLRHQLYLASTCDTSADAIANLEEARQQAIRLAEEIRGEICRIEGGT